MHMGKCNLNMRAEFGEMLLLAKASFMSVQFAQDPMFKMTPHLI